MKAIGIGWEVGVPSGWGMYGLNLSVELVRRGIDPALFFVASPLKVTQGQAEVLKATLARHPEWHALFTRGAFKLEFPLLHALGDELLLPGPLRPMSGTPTVGVAFCEHATIRADNLAVVRDLQGVITGSSWNTEILRRHGLTAVRYCPQGIDLGLFKPGAKPGRFGSCFTVFSGGKLEYRKGQDLVIAAFKRFHARRPDALLVCAWHSPWPKHAARIAASPHVSGAPPFTDGKLDIASWLTANGLPPGSFADLGGLSHADLRLVLRDMDVAVLPSRCEGGTNLVAMECMATGIPAILSRNTGHLDLIAGDNCYSLDFQIPMAEVTGRADLDGWGESSIDEIVAKLEAAYVDREDARHRGAAGAAFMQNWGWPAQVGRLLEAVAEFS